MKDSLKKSALGGVERALSGLPYTVKRGDTITVSAKVGGGRVETLETELDSKRRVMVISSLTGLKVKEKYRREFSSLISEVNYALYDGSYDFDLQSGELCYRLTTAYSESWVDSAIIDREIKTALTLDGCMYETLERFASTREYPAFTARSPKSRGDRALKAYEELKGVLRRVGFRCKAYDDKLKISFDKYGDDLPMSFDVFVDDELLTLESVLPFTVEEGRRKDLSCAACIVTNLLIDGSFCFQSKDGKIIFRLTTSYKDELGGKALEYMYARSLSTVERYNDKFHRLSRGRIKLKDFIDEVYDT